MDTSNSTIKAESQKPDGCCRVCLTSNKILRVFDKEIIDKILFCTGVQFSDKEGTHSQICSTCIENLYISHKFKTQCMHAMETFRRLYEEGYSYIDVINLKSEDDFNVEDDLKSNDLCNSRVDLKSEFLNFDTEVDVEKDFIDEDDIAVKSEEDLKDEKKKKKGKRKQVKTAKAHSKKSDAVRLKKKLSLEEKPVKELKPRGPRGPYNKTGPRFRCDVCKVKFTTKKEKRLHRRMAHKQLYVCELCGKELPTAPSLWTHKKFHLPPTFSCDQCDYKTWLKASLIAHMRTHAGLKLFQCEFCPRSCSTKTNLTGHIRQVHEKVKPYQCDMCDRSFYSRNKLSDHINSHTGVKSYECEICHSRFTRRFYWRKHLRCQHGVVVPAMKPGKQNTIYQQGANIDAALTSDARPKTEDYQLDRGDCH